MIRLWQQSSTAPSFAENQAQRKLLMNSLRDQVASGNYSDVFARKYSCIGQKQPQSGEHRPACSDVSRFESAVAFTSAAL